MSTLGRQCDEMERGEMSDSTNPPHSYTYNDAINRRQCSCGGALVIKWQCDSEDDPTAVPLVRCVEQTDGDDVEPTSPITYVCGERNDKCVCIEDHHTHDTATSDKTWHVCHQCGDEWYT